MVRRVNIALFLSFIFLSNGYAGGLVITQMLGNPEIYKNDENGAFPETVGAMLKPGKELIVAGKGSITKKKMPSQP